MTKLPIEKNAPLLALGAFFVFSIGAFLTTVIPPLVDSSLVRSEYPLHEYTEQEMRGMTIYKNEGCVYCHTQQIRNLAADQRRYGWKLVQAPSSESWEYANDKWHFLGTERTGPDLARVGGKYSSEWHWAHLKDPRNMGEKFKTSPSDDQYRSTSVMPSFKHLSDGKIKDLTAYLQTLGRNKNWRKDKEGILLNDYEN